MVCRTLCQKSYHKKKKAGGADQGVDREFKPYYHQKKKKRFYTGQISTA
jgi:hypothetical protein